MSDFWNGLFSSGEGNRLNIELRESRKSGRPFLLFPRQSSAAAVTLDLYPAQSFRARLAKSLLRFSLRTGLPIGLRRTSLSISSNDEFVKFLMARAGSTAEIPLFGILAGNPAHDTQRFVVLLFDRNRRPVSVVKAGLSGPAKALIDKELQFLCNVPAKTIGIPKARASFADTHVRAFGMDFVEGDSPTADDESQLPIVLASWISTTNQISLHKTAAWSRLDSISELSQKYPFLDQIHERTIQATVQHGDFVPWNIKVSNGVWAVLDWERGYFNGIPGWDWFHYVTQTGILVGHQPVHEIAERLEHLLASEAFRVYSKQSDIIGIERELFIAYLVHLIEVINPAEGLEPNRALLASLLSRWFKSSPM